MLLDTNFHRKYAFSFTSKTRQDKTDCSGLIVEQSLYHTELSDLANAPPSFPLYSQSLTKLII